MTNLLNKMYEKTGKNTKIIKIFSKDFASAPAPEVMPNTLNIVPMNQRMVLYSGKLKRL